MSDKSVGGAVGVINLFSVVSGMAPVPMNSPSVWVLISNNRDVGLLYCSKCVFRKHCLTIWWGTVLSPEDLDHI